MTGRIDPSVIAAIKARVPVSRVVGQVVKLVRRGREWVGLCPFHSERTPSFTVADDKGWYHCFGCSAHGGVIDFVMEHQGVDFVEAVRRLSDEAGIVLARESATPRAELERKPELRDAHRVPTVECAQWMWRTAGRAEGEIVEAWLAARGLDVSHPLVRQGLRALRYHPRCPIYAWKMHERPEALMGTRPAMLALIERIEGPAGARTRVPMGVHVTYLSPDGRSKAQLGVTRDGKPVPTRKMFGDVAGGGVWLGPVDDSGPLLVGEGIETTLSAACLDGRPTRMVAALSLGNLEGKAVCLRDGALPIWNVQADASRPPMLIDDAGHVIVAIDADMKALKGRRVQWVRGGKTGLGDVSGPDRARICATLAVQAWRRAGAWPVEAIRPPMGADFNDLMRGAA